MGVEQVITCDCCGERLNSTSVLDCVSVQYMQTNEPVQDRHYGLACGCGQAALTAVSNMPHVEHTPAAPPTDTVPAEHTEILNNPAGT